MRLALCFVLFFIQILRLYFLKIEFRRAEYTHGGGGGSVVADCLALQNDILCKVLEYTGTKLFPKSIFENCLIDSHFGIFNISLVNKLLFSSLTIHKTKTQNLKLIVF